VAEGDGPQPSLPATAWIRNSCSRFEPPLPTDAGHDATFGVRLVNDDLQSELAVVSQQIDGLDGNCWSLLNQRARYAQQVGEIKARHGEAGFIYRPEREAQVLQRIQEINPGTACRTRA
jgi:chorismate mutase-like protein